MAHIIISVPHEGTEMDQGERHERIDDKAKRKMRRKSKRVIKRSSNRGQFRK